MLWQRVAKFGLARLCSVQLRQGAVKFIKLSDKGEHDRQVAPGRGAQQCLQLHPQDSGLVQPDPNGPPAHGRVWLILRHHIGQHLVRADIQRAKHHLAPFGGIHDPRILRDQLGAFGHLVLCQKLQFRAKQAHPLSARTWQRWQIRHQAGIHEQVDDGVAFRLSGLVARLNIAIRLLTHHRDFIAHRLLHAFIWAQVHIALVTVKHDCVTVERLTHNAFGTNEQRNGQRSGHNSRMGADRSLFQHNPAQAAAIVEQFAGSDIAGDENRVGWHLGTCVAALPRQEPQ